MIRHPSSDSARFLIGGESYGLFAELVSLNTNRTRDVRRVSHFRLIAQCRPLEYSHLMIPFAQRAVQWLAAQPAAQVNQLGLTLIRDWLSVVVGAPRSRSRYPPPAP